MNQIVRGEIWLAQLDPTKGTEQAGTRPVLIASSDYFNQGRSQLVFVIPITSIDRSIRSHVPVLPPEGGLSVPSFVMCEALRSISKERLVKKLGVVSVSTIKEVEDYLTILLDL